MGCSCEHHNEEIIINQANITKIKAICEKEYNSYLNHIYKIKGYLNTSQSPENILIDNRMEIKRENNIATKKEFYLIPSKWFEDWEKWTKGILIKNEYKFFKTKFKYKNFKNKTKFYFYLMLEENWIKISKNKMYNFSEDFKTKIGLICNNLIILQYDSSIGEKNDIEIFFFEKDDDLFLTNLLFSFEKCNDVDSERNNLLKLLKSSPIYEILGNMYYDQSQSEFIEEKKKIVIFNKTRTLNEEMKRFRKKQYELYLESLNKPEKEEKESEKADKNKNKSGVVQETILININPPKNKINNIPQKNESQAISRASTIMNVNHQNLVNNNVNDEYHNKLKNKNKEDIFMDNMNDDEGKKNFQEIKRNDKLLLDNKLRNISRMSKIDKSEGFNSNFNELEITEIVENKINESLLTSIIYCFFNVAHLRDFIYKSFDINIESTRLYLIFSNMMNYLYEKICTSNNSIDSKKIKNIKFNLIKNCEDYNYQKLVEIIRDEPGKNLITKMINLIHSDINKKFKNYSSKKIKKNKDPKYNEFVNSVTSIHNSIIFDLFFGIKKVTKTCINCRNKLSTYKIFNVINISIDKIKKNFLEKEINRQKTDKTEDNSLSIEECLIYYLKEENDDKGLLKCSFCNSNTDFRKIKEIYEYPICTIFYLNYDNQESTKINLKKNIVLSYNEYELIGIIDQEINNNAKKYIPYCQDISNKIWFKYGDENIIEIDINKEKESINHPNALFYQKKK